MDNHVFYFEDEQHNAVNAQKGALKMIIGADGLSLLALGADREVLGMAAIQPYDKKVDSAYLEASFQETLAQHPLLKHPFGNVSVRISTPLATLVPRRLFEPQHCHKYFTLLQPEQEGVLYGYELLDGFDCYLVWGAPASLQYVVNRFQPHHIAGALIPCYRQIAAENRHSIFANIRANLVQIVVYEQRNLVFYNAFEFNRPADLLYCVLLAYDQFRLNPEQVPLQLSGTILETGEHYKMLYKYIRDIQFLASAAPVHLPNQENALPPHCWFDLLSI
jgi:Protein of unknown function (DUF3822)